MLWIPITLWAAFAQTVRNAAQRHLTAELGTLGATLVRFLYGLPFAALWLLAVHLYTGDEHPGWSAPFIAWLLVGAVSQIIATALLLRTMHERNLRSAWPTRRPRFCRSRFSRWCFSATHCRFEPRSRC
jgi:hypothetical protein